MIIRKALVLPALLAAAAAQEAPRPFSHKLHLELKLECVSCHSGAPKSTRVEDNNLPSPEACRPCHEKVRIKEPRPHLINRFNHSRHLQLGSVGPVIAAAVAAGRYLGAPGSASGAASAATSCEACHRGLRASDAVTGTEFPQMADCLVCHSKVEPPFSCEYCHSPGPHLKPANHTADFIDLHSSGKARLDKTTCAVCHGRKFRCLGCH